MGERHQVVQKSTTFDVGGGTEHCGPSESRFVAFHVHPFEICTPSANFAFGVAYNWSTGRTGAVVHRHLSKKVPPVTIQERSIREKNGGNLACGMVRRRSPGSHNVGV